MSVPIAQGASRPATVAAEPPDEPPGTRSRSHGLSTGPKPEFSFDEPIANSSMFVLPSTLRPGLGELSNRGRRVWRLVALEDPRARGRRHTLGAEDVLDRDRDACQRARSPFSAARLAAPEIGVQLIARRRLGPGAGVLARPRSRRRRSSRLPRRPSGRAAPPRLGLRLRRRDPEGALARVGRRVQHPIARPARPRLVGPQDVLQVDDVGGRLGALEVELGDPVDVVEDPGELRATSARPPPRSAAAAPGGRRGAPVRGRSRGAY